MTGYNKMEYICLYGTNWLFRAPESIGSPEGKHRYAERKAEQRVRKAGDSMGCRHPWQNLKEMLCSRRRRWRTQEQLSWFTVRLFIVAFLSEPIKGKPPSAVAGFASGSESKNSSQLIILNAFRVAFCRFPDREIISVGLFGQTYSPAAIWP